MLFYLIRRLLLDHLLTDRDLLIGRFLFVRGHDARDYAMLLCQIGSIVVVVRSCGIYRRRAESTEEEEKRRFEDQYRVSCSL